MKLTILYIVGAGNSGSTVLADALGRHSDVLNLGELSALDGYVTKNKECSCGENLMECEFWGRNSILEECAPIKPAPIKLLDYIKYKRNAPLYQRLYLDIVRTNSLLYRSIKDECGCRIIVDSSKDTDRLSLLARSGKFHIVPVYLVRDCRAYIVSMRERLGYGPIRSIFRWLKLNLASKLILDLFFKEDYIKVKYEEFTNNTDLVVERIMHRVGINFQEGKINETTFKHQLNGTAVRNGRVVSNLLPNGSIKTKNKWVKKLTVRDRIIFYILLGNLMNSYFGSGEKSN